MSINDPTKNPIVDFIEDEAFYAFKKNKAELEKATLALYIFATLSLLSYVFFLMLHTGSFDWINFAINILVIIIYYGLAFYSSHEPFNAFVSSICIVGIVLMADVFFLPQFTVKGLILKIVLIVYISMRLETAKKVQSYELKNKKQALT